jgi:FkbM family methyltransferase
MAKKGLSAFLTYFLGDERGLVTLTTRKGPAKGLRFGLDLRQPRMEYGYWYGSYDLRIVQAIASLCQPGWTAWDCGTYLGYYTCLFARLVGPTGRVVAFEPDPHNLERTKQNVHLNGFGNVSFEHVAIGGPFGDIDLLLSHNTNSHLPGVYVGASREDYRRIERVDSVVRVHCTSLDDAYYVRRAPRPDIIKIDIEGAESIALQYTDNLCREVRPLIILELHNPECDRAAWDWAQKQGYSIKSLDTGCILVCPEDVHGTLLCSPVR